MSEFESDYETIEIKNFELRYDGMFHITWNENEKVHQWYIHLSFVEIYWMIEKEGLSSNELFVASYEAKPLFFSKVVLKIRKDKGAFEAYGFYEPSEKDTLRVDGFTVELFKGDNIKRYKDHILLANFEIANDDFNTTWGNSRNSQQV